MTFEELYKHELEHRERLRAAIGIPVGLLVVIGGLLGAILQSFWFEAGILCYWFWLAVLGSALFFVRAVYFLVRSYHGHTYRVMPFALESRTYRDALRDWHARYGNGPHEGDREYEDYLERLYAEAADHNAYENAAKSEHLFRANTFVVCCVISAAVTFVPFAIHRVSSPAVVHKIEITNQSATASRDQETRMSNDKPNPVPPSPPQVPPQSPPPKPPAPPLRNLKEGQIPERK
jgi:hypothetical protein